MSKMWSPLEIEVLLHHYYSPEPFRRQSPASKTAELRFLKADILRSTDDADVYVLTPRGNAFREMLLSTPIPEAKWIDPRFDSAGEK